MIVANQIFRNFTLKQPCLYSIACASSSASNKKRIPLITCQNKKFDLYLNDKRKKVETGDEIPLASKGWQHYKAKGDHFIIHQTKSAHDILVGAKEYSQLGLDEKLVKNLEEKHDITNATQLQVNCMQELFNNQHVLLAAETGCGKVNPIFRKIQKRLSLIIFRPTRTWCPSSRDF